MGSLVDASAREIADALAPAPQIPSARWRWGTVVAVGSYGTMDVSVGGTTLYGIRCAQHVMGAQVGDRVRVLYLGTEAMVDAIRAADSEPHINVQAWLDALGLSVEDLLVNSTFVIRRSGRVIQASVRGVSAAASGGGVICPFYLSDYLPPYHLSSVVTDLNGHVARMWLSANDGGLRLEPIGYTGTGNWYGTLTYIY